MIRSARSALAAALVMLALPFATARADGPGPYETVVHARARREKGTTLVITAKELTERGVDNLAEALDLMPEVIVRQGGNGQMRIDLRGAKQREMLILIDGVPVDEPWQGTFDLASIPVTDIVEIRVTLAPASPLEGPGGDGGIVEVMTLKASGGRRLDARVRASTAPDALASITGRTPLASGLALRGSAGGRWGEPSYAVIAPGGAPAQFQDADGQAHTSLRLEKEWKHTRVTGDAWYEHRSYFIPPTDTEGAQLQAIRGEDAFRAVVG
ncbi:MAG: TonB-dependent receptor, partial [Polyangia bacterium]